MKASKLLPVATFLLVFGGFHYLLNRHPGHLTRPTEEQIQLTKEMARFVEQNPQIAQPIPASPPPAGPEAVFLIRPEDLTHSASKEKLMTQLRENPDLVFPALQKAWISPDFSSSEQREVLQELLLLYQQLKEKGPTSPDASEEAVQALRDSFRGADLESSDVQNSSQQPLETSNENP
jgi:hypothetical protein